MPAAGQSLSREEESRLERVIEGLRPELIETLAASVRIPSIVPTFPGEDPIAHLGREGEVSRLVADALADSGCEVDLFGAEEGRENCAAALRGAGGGRSLILNGHVDVVPAQPAEQWTGGDPWSGRVEDDHVWGRGSCDMKGGLMAAVFAIRALAEAGIGLRGDLLLHAVVGEEMMEHELGTTACLERGHTGDAAVVAEPSPHGSPLAVCPVTPGVMWFTLRVRGKGAHAGMRAESIRPGGAGAEIGVNAADLTRDLQNELAELEREWQLKTQPLFRPGSFTIHAGVVQASPDAGPMPFGLAEHGILEYILWHSPGDEPDDVRAEVESRVARVAEADPWLTEHPPELEWRHHWPPARLDPDHELVASVARAHRASVGADASVEAFSAVADVTYYELAGIPALTYGPGDIALAHAVDERVPIDEVVSACRTFALLAADWCGT